VRSIDALAVNTAGVLCGFFPSGDLVFPVGRQEVIALDAAVRQALGGFRVVPSEQQDDWPGIGPLTGYLHDRLPAFERGLLAERSPMGDLTSFAAALRLSPATLAARLHPDDAGGLPTVVLTTLSRAAATLTGPHLPDVIAEHVRRNALAVAAPGWRPGVDPSVWIPDAIAVASAVDHERWPVRPPVVSADISDLVLFAALCAVGPSAETVTAGPLSWRGLGGFGEDETDVDPGRVPPDAVVVGLSIHDDTVERLEYALTPDGGYLAVRLPAPDGAGSVPARG
jgi:hypothetical protein